LSTLLLSVTKLNYKKLEQFLRDIFCCFYSQTESHPCIQINKPMIYWLSYDHLKLKQNIASFYKEYRDRFNLTNLKEFEDITLDYCSECFGKINFDFFLLSNTGETAGSIVSPKDIVFARDFFLDYLQSKTKENIYYYYFKNCILDDVIRLNESTVLYGSGTSSCFFKDVKVNTGISYTPELFLEKDSYFLNLNHFSKGLKGAVFVVHATSHNDAIISMNRLFGALCISINKPFHINQESITQSLGCFKDNGEVTSETFTPCIPSVFDIVLDKDATSNLKTIYSRENELTPSELNRRWSSLAFVAYGWTHVERDRFLNHVITLDALYGKDRG
jgi:hypothetical protein